MGVTASQPGWDMASLPSGTQEPMGDPSTHIGSLSPLTSITRLTLLPRHQGSFGV